jgi:antitoxin YobK
MIDSVKVVRELESVPLADAKAIVDDCPTWRDMRDVNREWRSRALEAFERFESARNAGINGILALARDHPDADFVGTQPATRVDAAERRLGMSFPEDYRQFLLELGTGNLGGHEIYGVFRDDFEDSGVPDVVWATLDARVEVDLGDSGILVGHDGSEGKIVLDTGRRQTNGSAPVVWWAPGEPLDAAPMLAEDFSSYLLQILVEAPP